MCIIIVGIIVITNMGVPVWSFSDCTLGGQKGSRCKKNPFLCTTQQSFACWWMFCSTGHVWELIADNIRKARYFLRLEIKCSVRYSGKRGGHKGSSLRYHQSRQLHLVCVCLWCFVYTLFIKSAAAIIGDCFFQVTLLFKRKAARNVMCSALWKK